MIKKCIAFCMALSMLLTLAACGSPAGRSTPGADPSANGPAQGTPAQDAASGTRTVTDVFGRAVVIPDEIKTIAALGSAARLVCYAGAADRLIGVTGTDLNISPGRPYSYIYQEQLSQCGQLAEGGNGADYAEAIVTAGPDIIFYFDSDPVAMEELARQTMLPVVGVYAETCFDETFYRSLDLMGDILGTGAQTTAIIQALKGWEADLDSRTANIPDEEKPTVYAGAVTWSGGHGIEGTYGQYAPFTAVHARHVTDETGVEGYMEVDREQIAAWDPDIIFLTISNMDLVNEDYAGNPGFYNNLSAVKNGRVYSQVSFNSYWCNLELAVVNAYYAGTVLYPEQFADVDFEAKADEIFNVMLGSDYVAVMRENGMEFRPLTIGA